MIVLFEALIIVEFAVPILPLGLVCRFVFRARGFA